MSGFAGIVRLDGRRVERSQALHLAAAVAHRGGDGQGEWSDDAALLVHAMLATTAEARQESQPVADGHSVIVADLRIDNREELLGLLDLRGQFVGDAGLVLAAFRRWGVDCVRHLEGDFSFAIWSARERTLFCARDPFGVKPFVYALLPGKLFAFASEPRALLAIGEVPRDVDEKRIANFLAVRFEDAERTFYRAVRRLPGGCTLLLRDGKTTVSRYWSPDDIRPAPRMSDSEYAEGFREHFVRAVRARMRATDPSELGSMLSGGLDSSAITCVARDELRAAGSAPLHAFSWIFSDVPSADEREYQELVAAAGGIVRHTIDSATAGYSPWSDLELLLPDGPPFAPNFYLNLGAAKLARSLGVRVILDGLGGDGTISCGGPRFVELFVRGRFATLLRELRALAHTNRTGRSLPLLFFDNVIRPLTPPQLFRLSDALRRRQTPGRHASYHPHLSVRQEHVASLRSPLLVEGLELVDRVATLSGVEIRYPFFDRRLVEYCVSLPGDQKFAEGHSRVVARRALRGVVPQSVLWRPGKGKPGLHFIPAIRSHSERLAELFAGDPSALAPYRQFIDGEANDFLTAVKVWSAAAAAEWIRQLRG